MFSSQLLGALARTAAPRPVLGAVHVRPGHAGLSLRWHRGLATSTLRPAKAKSSSSDDASPGLPAQDAPAEQKASTLENASRAHKDLTIDPDTVVTPNAESALTTREAKVDAQIHKPRHAGENPPGVPPQALKRAPETFNIKIPFPSRQSKTVSGPQIPVINPTAVSNESEGEAIKKPPSVIAVADEERVHSPVSNAGLSEAEEDKLEKDFAHPKVTMLHQAGVPPALARQAVVLYDKARHHFYSLLPNGFFAPVEPIPGATGPDGQRVFRFSPGVLPRELNENERKGLVVLITLIFLAFVGSMGIEMIFLSNSIQLANEARTDAQVWRAEHPGETVPSNPRYLLESHDASAASKE